MIFFRISRQIPENSDVCRFFNQICENKSEICRKFWILWKLFTIIQNYSLHSLKPARAPSRPWGSRRCSCRSPRGRRSRSTRRSARPARPWWWPCSPRTLVEGFDIEPFSDFSAKWANFVGLVLFCIDAKFFKKIFVGKLLTRSTGFTCFCTAQTSIFQKIFVKFLAFFCECSQKFVFFIDFCSDFDEILSEFRR